MNYDYVETVLIALKREIKRLTIDEYNEPLHLLSGGSIGAHSRHIIEMFHCLELGYLTGVVNYDNRDRNESIQTDPDVAIQHIDLILNTVQKEDKNLILQSLLLIQGNDLETSYHRELQYCIEHCIHHQAILKIALILLKKDVDEEFGVAKSTLENRKNVYS